MDEIAGWVAIDDDLPGAPGRDTIRRIIRDPVTPPSQADVVALVSVLATAAGRDRDTAAGVSRDLWVAARLEVAPGVPLDEVRDPYALEVHRPIALDDVTGLPPYVRRAHDDRLSRVVEQAVAGSSAAVVLVGGSSAGKTRACWEALQPLRDAGGWRLWHPYDPTRRDAAVAALDRVGPHTVVWLNETQEYLKDDAERIAAKVRTLLADPSRAPILVLGTLWPEHHAVLTQLPGTQVQLVLHDAVIEVPEFFAGHDLAAMEAAASVDPRLEWAVKHADDGQITQYLAGAPELMIRFNTAPAPAKAVLWAAMDLRRFGHRNALPQKLLEYAADAYLTQAQRSQLRPDWLDQALAYTARPAKGALGPLTPVTSESQPVYQLADYLEQAGRTQRTEQLPPNAFWLAVATYAHPGDLNELGQAAWDRGLYRIAAQIRKNAVIAGYAQVDEHILFPGLLNDTDSVTWIAHHVRLDDPVLTRVLIAALHRMGFRQQFAALLARNPASCTKLDNPYDVAYLLWELHAAGAAEQVAALADGAATHAPVNPLSQANTLFEGLRKVGAREEARRYLARTVAHSLLRSIDAVTTLLTNLSESDETNLTAALLARDPAAQVDVTAPDGAARLVLRFHEMGAVKHIATLASRTAAQVSLDRSQPVERLAVALRRSGAAGQAGVLAERILRMPLDDIPKVVQYLPVLHRIGADDTARALADRVATQAPLDDPFTISDVLTCLRNVGADEQARALAGRLATGTSLDDLESLVGLVAKLRETGDGDQAAVLLTRAANEMPLSDARSVAHLLTYLHDTGCVALAATVVAREPAAHVSLDDPFGVGYLLLQLYKMGVLAQVKALSDRASDSQPEGMAAATHLLSCFRRVNAERPLSVLAARVVHQTPLDGPSWVSLMIKNVKEAGKAKQIDVLLARIAVMPLSFYDLDGLVNILTQLREIGMPGHATAFAERIALELPDHRTAARLLRKLDEAGAADLVRILVARADRVPFGRSGPDSLDQEVLVRALEEMGAIEQGAKLIDRFPAAGAFATFLRWDDHAGRFRYGREPDGRPSVSWSWADLT
ncbi:hypothetical protein ACWEVP_35775 [Amycolatopsis sp. NPDC003865]